MCFKYIQYCSTGLNNVLYNYIIKIHMKQPQKTSKKLIGEGRKHSISEKTRSDYSNPFNSKEETFSPFITKGIKNSMGRKYAQEHLFKQKEKQHHEIVISDEVVKNSKLFRMLKEKIQTNDTVFVKEMNQLNQIKAKLKQQIAVAKSHTYNHKLSLWQLKNQILEMRGILNDQQQECRRLQGQISNPQNPYYPEDEQQRQMQLHNHLQQNNYQQHQENYQQQQHQANFQQNMHPQQQQQKRQQKNSFEDLQVQNEHDLKTSFPKLQLKDYTNPEDKSEVQLNDHFNQ